MSPEAPPYRFALLAHSPDVAESVRLFVHDSGYDTQFRIVNFTTAVSVARECLQSGTEVVICHGGTGNSILQALGHSVVAIDRTDMDVIKTVRRASAVGRDMVLAAYLDEEHDMEAIEELLDVRLHHIAYSSSEELFASIDDLYRQGVRVLVGGGVSKAYMERLGGTGFVIAPNRHSIEKAFRQAEAIARRKRREIMQHEDLLAVFKQLGEGVVSVDAAGRLLFVNQRALNLLRLPRGLGAQAGAILERLLLPEVLASRAPSQDALVEINGAQLVVATLPTFIHHGEPGAVALFQDVAALQKINRKIGEELYAKGFVARYDVEDILGQTPGIRTLKKKILDFAPTSAAVLINGETGTGKELAAHALHKRSTRSAHPFVAVNCGAVPENLLESELFGYEEGAFTGARRGGKAGLFELANNGTLFLDEVGEISHEMQLRLLRVLEAGEVMRVGGSRFLPVEVRIVSASHKPLLQLVAERKFRRDLYYRLSTLKIQVPPLRERLDDAALLVRKLLPRYGKAESVLCPELERQIRTWNWPGNIRELLAVMESYLIQLKTDGSDPELFAAILQENMMPEHADIGVASPFPSLFDPEGTLRDNLNEARRFIVERTVTFHGGDRKAAARSLGINYSTLWRAMSHGGSPEPSDSESG
ncbi:sigma 54-interacting transcriptional regulator [Nitratidesulfovibrio sp.]|uniref:sigma 54-interacting transcriptional regulator n=1 Tax=Nitratidesulfovibrio sp. TaxID=2802297 RepID=UPI00333EDFD1